MTTDPYNERVRALFASPVHAGRIDNGVRVAVADQGVRLQFSGAARGGAIESLRFLAWGCPHVIAAAEATCATYEGRAIEDLEDFAVAELMQSLAVPVEKTGRILVIEDAVRSLGQALREASG